MRHTILRGYLFCFFSVNMSSKTHTKTMSAYKELDEPARRLVNKLITGLHEQRLDPASRLTINRTLNRTRRDPNDTGKKYTNGYLVFYRERFLDLKTKGKPVTAIAQQVGSEWNALNDEERSGYIKQAAQER